VHCGVLPRMCLTQVLKMFVLLSYEVVPQAGQRQPYRRCCYPATGRPGLWRLAGPGTAHRIRAAVMAGDRLAGAPAVGTGPHSCSPLCLTATGGRAAARVLARAPAHGTVSERQRTTALRRLLPSSKRLVPMISGVPDGTPATAGNDPSVPLPGKSGVAGRRWA
jgi:hypothetical protein